ncbi:MAG TPA: S8 family peptidase [Solirubrobacteraceae bacterium]
MLELDGQTLSATVAFSKRVDLAGFLDRLARYRAASPTERGNLLGADLFDAIDEVRFYGPRDRITPRLAELLAATPRGAIEVDIEIWHPGDASSAEEARAWAEIVRAAVASAEGNVIDSFTNHDVGLLLLRVRVEALAIATLAQIDEIASIDLKPTVAAAVADHEDLTAADLPSVAPSPADSPLFAIIDSGVSGSHPLISPALYEATTLLSGLRDGADDHGHGTAVAGLALHGSAEDWLQVGVLAPHARLLSIRVLDEHNEFPVQDLWPKAVAEAVAHAAALGCRVVNLSLGDSTAPMADRRATRVAAVLDDLARRHGLVLVIPTGNVDDPTDYTEPSHDADKNYARAMLASSSTTLLDPAPAALALTVGALGASAPLPLGEKIVGGPTSPSANTRRGPGIARGLKPELSAPGGTFALNDTIGFVDRRQLQPIVLSHHPDALFERQKGTSFAAPLVTRVATAVQATYPDASAPLIRALVLQAASSPALPRDLLPSGTRGEIERQTTYLVGHGRPALEAARFSSPNRVVLIDQVRLEVDRVVLYEVPIPASFFESGGTRTIDLAVCFDPLTRYRRKDYLGSRLFPYLVIGHNTDDIVRVLSQADDAELETDVETDEPTEDDGELTPSSLAQLRRVDLRPSTAMSSDSANILLRRRFTQYIRPADPPVFHLAIRSTARWSPEGTEDAVGVALALGHDKTGIDLHAELRAQLEVAVQLEIPA